jgi:hypothetical protein
MIGAPALTVHLLEFLRVQEPPVQLEAANPEWMVEVLPRPRAKPIE